MDRPWYRRIDWPEPRFIALIVAGVLVLGAGTAYAITQLAGSSSSKSGSQAPQGDLGTGTGKSKAASLDPSKVTVAVLNGTRIPGLAARVGDKVQSGGFQLGNVATANEAQRAESIVEFKAGQNRAARAVARRLHISQIEPLDPSSGDQGLAGDAQVLVIVGADQQHGRSSSSSGSSSGSGTSSGTGSGTPSTGTTGSAPPSTGTPSTGGTGTPGTGGTATTP